jgi:hypothetical protein
MGCVGTQQNKLKRSREIQIRSHSDLLAATSPFVISVVQSNAVENFACLFYLDAVVSYILKMCTPIIYILCVCIQAVARSPYVY